MAELSAHTLPPLLSYGVQLQSRTRALHRYCRGNGLHRRRREQGAGHQEGPGGDPEALGGRRQKNLSVLPGGLVKREDFPTLATNAMKGACGLTNPKQLTHNEVVVLYEKAFTQ